MKILRREYKLSELLILKESLIKILVNPRKIINLLLVRISFLLKTKKCFGMPLNIYIEPTARCNYQCLKCEKFSHMYSDDGLVFDKKNMPFHLYKNIIDEIGDTLLTLRLWHYGEPLLHDKIFEMIKYAKRKDIIVAISSNLSLIDEKKAFELVETGLDYLVVSCDGASRETYEYYNGKDYFEKAINNVKSIVNAKKKLRSLTPLVELQFIVMKKNEKEINKIKNLAKELGVNKVTLLKVDITNLNFNDNKRIKNKMDLLPLNKNFHLDIKKLNTLPFCSIPWEETEIRYSGVVLPCCQDLGQRQEMGRLFNNNSYNSFRDIWNNNYYQNFRRDVSKKINDINICFNCAQRDVNNIDQILSD